MTRTTEHNPERLPPIHPGEILSEEFLVPLNVSQYRLAKAIGVDARRIHAIVHGERAITAETALLFSRFFGNSAEFWMGLQSQYDLETAADRLAERLDLVTGVLERLVVAVERKVEAGVGLGVNQAFGAGLPRQPPRRRGQRHLMHHDVLVLVPAARRDLA